MAPSDAQIQEGGGAPDQGRAADVSRQRGYETSDASGRTLAWVMLIGVAAIAASIGGIFVLIAHYHHEDAARPPLTPEQRAAITPPGPHLQGAPYADLAAERHRETDLLGGFAYIDADHRRARIPIDRAEALVLGKPLDPAP